MEQQTYAKTFADELDWVIYEQRHRVVLQISSFCFRTKQLCLAVEIAVIGLLFKFTDNSLDATVFVAGFFIPLGFWFIDGVAYYNQIKMRGIMAIVEERLTKRNLATPLPPSIQILSGSAAQFKTEPRILPAFCNHSMWLYALLIISDLLLYGLIVVWMA